MNYEQRMSAVRDYGPRRPLLRIVLTFLAMKDKDGGDGWVFAGLLERETGWSDRAIREALRELVLLGLLEPRKAVDEGDPYQQSRNQYVGGPWQPAARPRVHGHKGGCMPGGKGCRTHYRIVYPEAPVAERPRGRKAGKGERGATQGGTGRRAPNTQEPTGGNGAPQKGEAGAEQGGTPFPLSRSLSRSEVDTGGDTPPTPQAVAEGDTSNRTTDSSGAPLPLAADAAQGPQGSLLGADAPEGSQGREGIPGKQVRARWSFVITQAAAKRQGDPGWRLWIETPKVKPITVEGDQLHVRVPSALWAKNAARYGPDLAAAAALLTDHPITITHFHPETAA